MKLSKEDAQGILKSRSRIPSGSGYTVTGNVTSVNQITNDAGKVINIVNLNLITAYGAGEAKALFLAGKYDDACNKHMSINLLTTASFTPIKGQDVMCTIGTYNNKDGVAVQTVKRVNPLPVAQTTQFSFDEEEEVVEAEETVEEAVTAKK